MSDTTPNPQIPDAVSAEALRAALKQDLPEAVNLRTFLFGDTGKHEGLNDFLLLMMLICNQDDAPSVVQTMLAAEFLIALIDARMRSSMEETERRIKVDVDEFQVSHPTRSMAAAAALDAMTADHQQTRIHLSQLRLSIGVLKREAMISMAAVEKFHLLGRDTPNPGERQRFFSDRTLDDLGIDREAFDTFFARTRAD